jgi:hypothetical protein
VKPDENSNNDKGNAASGHKNGYADAELARVAAVWSKLPPPLKAAILTIVNSSTDSKEGE